MRVAAVILALVAGVSARSATGDRVLVVRDNKYEYGYNKFFESLKDRGYDLTFTEPKSDGSLIEAHGVGLYDHLVVFAPETKNFHSNLSPQKILAAQATYLNTLFVLSPSLDNAQAALLREYDIEPQSGVLTDAFSHVGGGDDTDVVLPSTSFISNTPILTSVPPVVYGKGAGFTTGMNPFLIDVASAPETAYLAEKDGKPVESTKSGRVVRLAGDNIKLAAAMQTRENVRIGFVGSPEVFNDQWWGKKLDGSETGNREFLSEFSAWLFQETGVVRVDRTHHSREGESEPREEYTKKDVVNYEITLSQHSTAANGSSVWTPVEIDDLQFEFTMLDPHIRKALPVSSKDASSTTYSTQFVAPDRHGVFKFVVNHFRPGWSYITAADKASVVPLRHDEHPRFIVGAYPFYTGALSTSAAFILFVFLWINLSEQDKMLRPKPKVE